MVGKDTCDKLLLLLLLLILQISLLLILPLLLLLLLAIGTDKGEFVKIGSSVKSEHTPLTLFPPRFYSLTIYAQTYPVHKNKGQTSNPPKRKKTMKRKISDDADNRKTPVFLVKQPRRFASCAVVSCLICESEEWFEFICSTNRETACALVYEGMLELIDEMM